MTKSRVAKAFAVAGVTMALAVTATTADAQKRVRWKLQSTWGAAVPHLGTSGVRFSDNIERLSDGKFQMKFHEPGALVPALECFDAASKGSVESCYTTPGYHTGKLGPGVSFFTAVPFGPQIGEFMAWKRYGGGDELRAKKYGEHGVMAFDVLAIGPETSGWFKFEVNDLAQLRGLKMRFFGLGAQVMQRLGLVLPAEAQQLVAAAEFIRQRGFVLDYSVGLGITMTDHKATTHGVIITFEQYIVISIVRGETHAIGMMGQAFAFVEQQILFFIEADSVSAGQLNCRQ